MRNFKMFLLPLCSLSLFLSLIQTCANVNMHTCKQLHPVLAVLYTGWSVWLLFWHSFFFSLVAKCSMFLILLSISFNFKRLMKVFLSLCNFYPGQFLFLTIVTWIWSHRFSIQIYVRVPFQKELASNGLQICLGWYTCNQCHNQCKKGCRFIFCRWSWGCACIIH